MYLSECLQILHTTPLGSLVVPFGVYELRPTFGSVMGRDPRVVVSTAAFHARVRSSVPRLGSLKETKNVSSPSTCESQYCGEPL